MVPDAIRNYLERRGVAHQVTSHAYRPTALETASARGIPAERFAKTVLLRAFEGGGYVLAVLPASEKIDGDRLRHALGRDLYLATEDEMRARFPEYEVGALPPFGELLGVPVVVDRCLAEAGFIAFRAGTHTDVVELRWEDFQRLTSPTIVEYGRPRWEGPTAAPPEAF